MSDDEADGNAEKDTRDEKALRVPSCLTGPEKVCYLERSIFPILSNRLARSWSAGKQELRLSWAEA
jgi:hypothetical protein